MVRGGDADAMPDEFSLIERLFHPLAGPEGLGLKDDAAVFTPRAGYDLVLTKDAIAEGRHYLSGDPPDTVARKLLRVNLSDLAAKGATPRGYLLSCAWSAETPLDWMQGFADGLKDDQFKFGLSLWGGDTIRVSGPTVFSLTAIGEVPSGQMVSRAGAAVGDDLWITGTIGDAALGLLVAQGEYAAAEKEDRDYLISRYRTPRPPVSFGKQLSGFASAALDVSDGLLADLQKLCIASGVSAIIERESVPLSSSACEMLSEDPELFSTVLSGGDDYQILFSAPGNVGERIIGEAEAVGTMATKIGQIVPSREESVFLRQDSGVKTPLQGKGFKHF